ncbi:MAG: hypothetical protein JOZ09_01115 [Pseudonocardiales bacterium]|nr:hypothetical protein [Pseudonocardiales bacterium]
MLDADADPGRRAWVACPSCDDGCMTCANQKTCDLHWQYLLASEARLLFLQCPVCMRRRWHDSRCGVGGERPDYDPLWVFATYHGDAA